MKEENDRAAGRARFRVSDAEGACIDVLQRAE